VELPCFVCLITPNEFFISTRDRERVQSKLDHMEKAARFEPMPHARGVRSPYEDRSHGSGWRAGRNAVYQLAALTIGARLAVADA
jgi:hypothetical protein